MMTISCSLHLQHIADYTDAPHICSKCNLVKVYYFRSNKFRCSEKYLNEKKYINNVRLWWLMRQRNKMETIKYYAPLILWQIYCKKYRTKSYIVLKSKEGWTGLNRPLCVAARCMINYIWGIACQIVHEEINRNTTSEKIYYFRY